MFAASPYHGSLATRDPARLRTVLGGAPDATLADILKESRQGCGGEADVEAAAGRLRRLKASCTYSPPWPISAASGPWTK